MFIDCSGLTVDTYNNKTVEVTKAQILVPDNLKSAIIKHSRKDGIIINESYVEMARFYDCIIELARP